MSPDVLWVLFSGTVELDSRIATIFLASRHKFADHHITHHVSRCAVGALPVLVDGLLTRGQLHAVAVLPGAVAVLVGNQALGNPFTSAVSGPGHLSVELSGLGVGAVL